MEGAAQIAATAFPSSARPAKDVTASMSFEQAARFGVPGMPPGRTSMQNSSGSASARVVSAVIVMLWEEVTVLVSFTEMVVQGIPARKRRSETVRASISSQPSARNRATFWSDV